MFYCISLFLVVIGIPASAWDSPLPFSNNSSTHFGQSAFANPASAALESGSETDVNWSTWDLQNGSTRRLWALQYQGAGIGSGVRYYEGSSPYQMRFDLAWATTWMRFFSPGIRLSYISSGSESDHGIVDWGFQFRPFSQLLLGYWSENFLTPASESSVNRVGLSVRPFANFKGWSRNLQFGLASNSWSHGENQSFITTQIPLYAGFRFESQWDFGNHEGSVGIVLQATPQWSGALGFSKEAFGPNENGLMAGKSSKPLGGRSGGVSYRPDQRTPFLFDVGNVAEVNLNTSVEEANTSDNWISSSNGIGILALQNQFDALEANTEIKAVIIKVGKTRCGWALAEEIRRRIIRLRKKGKHVIAYMQQVSPLGYFLASASDKIALQPQGYFAVIGLSAEVPFYKGFFDKLGVEPQFLRHGKFKSFEEPYTRTSFSEPARTNLDNFLASLWNHYLETVCVSRNMSKDSLKKVLESGEISLAHAKKVGLIDTLIQEEDALKLAGGPHARLDPTPLVEPFHNDWNCPPIIAEVVVTGDMILGKSARGFLAGPELAGSESVVEQLRRARHMRGLRAVVLRVDSPGGAAQAADIMWNEVEKLKADGIPVVASVGHNAASGGYYLICGADRILAEPNSTVGSIGVLWGKFVLKGLFEKLGLKVETVKTSAHADGNSMARLWDSSEVEILQKHMDDFYDSFISKVAIGRHKTKTSIDSLGQGQIFTGTEAVKNGLVDGLGGLPEAFALALQLSGMKPNSKYEIVQITGESEGRSLSSVGKDWVHAPSGWASFEKDLKWIRLLSEPTLWAISPELSGWTNFAGTGRE